MSLRARFALALAALAAAATVGASVISYFSTSNKLYEELDSSLSRASTTGLRERIFAERGGGRSEFGEYRFQALTEDGRRISAILPGAAAALPINAADVETAHGGGTVFRTVTIDGEPYRLVTTAAANVGPPDGRGVGQTGSGGPGGAIGSPGSSAPTILQIAVIQVARELGPTNRLLASLRDRYIVLSVGVRRGRRCAGVAHCQAGDAFTDPADRCG